MRLALYQPDIAQNTGTMLRTCACLGVPVDVIGPTGFDMSDRALRRSGMDYLAHVRLERHASWLEFDQKRRAEGRKLVLLSTHGSMPYTRHVFADDDTIMVGRESAGVPQGVADASDVCLRIPVKPGLRSLNVAVAAAMALGEAARQLRTIDETEHETWPTV